MKTIIAAALLSLGLAGPALAYGERVVPHFDAAAELRMTTGSVQYPESRGGVVREPRIGQGGSEAFPRTTRGIAHNGVDMMENSGAQYPVVSQGTLSHPPTVLSEELGLVHEFDAAPRRMGVAGTIAGDVDG